MLDIPEYSEVEAREILRFLRATNWLDAQTRALFLEFSLYLPPSNILLSARLVMEVHETGTIWTDMSLEPINLGIFRTDSAAETGLLVAGLLLAVVAMVWDIRSTWKMRRYHARQTGSVRRSLVSAAGARAAVLRAGARCRVPFGRVAATAWCMKRRHRRPLHTGVKALCRHAVQYRTLLARRACPVHSQTPCACVSL